MAQVSNDAPKKCLRVEGESIVDGSGKPVLLRGVGLGGWLNMENFITGFPSTEQAHRKAILEAVGPQKYERFFERFLSEFFSEEDADFLRDMGMNLLRVPFNYRHLEDDMHPFQIKEEGFRHLDRVVTLCASRGIYTILDLHALPGGQNQAWHSDNPTHKALFWTQRHFQERVINLWKRIAGRYRDNPWVAGYNPINEPADPSEAVIGPYYEELVGEIRSVDPDHVVFLDGNRYSRDFSMFTKVLPNAVYTNHDYAMPGLIDGGPYPGVSRGQRFDRQALKDVFLRRSEFMLSRGLPIWVGEFGPVYPGGDEQKDAMRYQVLSDQLEIYDEYKASWAIWTYKDIGLLEKKARFCADVWGSTDENVRDMTGPVEDLMAREFPGYDPFPSGVHWQVTRLMREILFSEAIIGEFGRLFEGITERKLDELALSFSFGNCVKRGRLVSLLKAHL
jgi:endoglucanase